MNDATSREKILKKIRRALVHKNREPFLNVDYDSNVFTEFEDVLEIEFAKSLSENGGRFVFCENKEEVIENLVYLIQESNWNDKLFVVEKELQEVLATTGLSLNTTFDLLTKDSVVISTCEYLVARNGSSILTSKQAGGRKHLIFGKAHIIIAETSKVKPELKDVLREFKALPPALMPSAINIISGPSKTSDIGGVSIIGAQGPEELFVFLYES
jgi:L-lactate dehydrogenase complex protein LldG